MFKEQIIKNLNNELLVDSIFYFYSDVVQLFIKEKIINEKDIDVFKGRVFFLDDKNIWDAAKIENTMLKVSLKASRLKNNHDQLIEVKENLSEINFKWILDKYIETLSGFLIISELQYSNFDNEIKENKLIKFKNIFRMQLGHIKEHHKNIITYFNINEVEKKVINYNSPFNMKANYIPKFQNLKKISAELQENNKADNDDDPEIKRFSDYIIHPKNKEIESIIISTFNNEKGKKIRFIIEYFIAKRWLTLGYGKKQKIYDAMKISFNHNIGAYPSIWGYRNFNEKDPDYLSTIDDLKIALKNFI